MDTFSAATRRQLERIAAEVSILGPRLFQLADDLPEMVSSEVTSYPNEYVANDLVRSLTNALYLRYYCGLTQPGKQTGVDLDLLAPLQEANASVEGWDRGWEIVNRDPHGRAAVRNGERTRLVALKDVRGADESDDGEGRVSLRRPREDCAFQPGYYYAIGEMLGDDYEEHVGARIYLNLTPEAAAAWMKCLTTGLNRHCVPFRFKVLRHRAAFARVDGGIVYVPRRYASFAASIVAEIAQTVGGLGDRTPAFTLRVGRGISIADSPPGGGSFGLHRMKLVAEGHVDAWASSSSSVRDRMRAITARFRWSGLSPERPWLNPGNANFVLRRPVRPSSTRGAHASTPWLKVSDRIGARLVRDAVWHRDRCTWLGWALAPEVAANHPAVCTIGGDLYSGTAGVATFLARLSAITGDERQRVTAMGALRHAVDQTGRGRWPVGAYTGLGGVLYAAIAVTDGCGGDEVAKRTVASLIEKLSISQPKDTEVDVLDGRAGAIRALLFAAEKRLDPGATALQSAIRFGHEIIGLAERGDDVWSWRTTDTATTRNLLGYSHGTAGIACALDDLFRVTGEHVFQQGARAAWQHEISWFDEGAQNWPDFRVSAADESGGESRGAQFAFSWCHGAPGTALALARHMALDPESRPHLEAVLGRSVETTIASIGPRRERVNGLSFCLCHGIAGNADILLEITRLSGRKDPLPAVLAAAHAGMDRHHESGDWPCGVPGGGETPALFLGLSGIGHFYLRLHDASVPSPLLF
jgi:hypothetical protein